MTDDEAIDLGSKLAAHHLDMVFSGENEEIAAALAVGLVLGCCCWIGGMFGLSEAMKFSRAIARDCKSMRAVPVSETESTTIN